MIPTQSRRALASFVLVALAALLPYLPALGHAFVYDDQTLLFDTQSTLRSALVDDLFGTDATGHAASGYWRPLVRASYWLGGHLFAEHAAPRHLTNLFAHAAVSLLLFGLLRRLSALRAIALPAALLFAAHPVHAESIAVITGRTDPFATVLGLIAAHAVLSGRDRRALITFAFALCAKESAAVFAPLLAGLAWMSSDAASRRVRSVKLLGACVALVAAFFAVKVAALDIVAPASAWRGSGNALERLATFVAVIPRYVGMLIVPARLSIVHDVALVTSIADARFWLGIGVLALLAVAFMRGRAAMRTGIGLFLFTLAPASNLVPITFAFRDQPFPLFERYLYVPSVFACIAIAHVVLRGAERLFGTQRAERGAVALAAILAVGLGVRTWVRVGDFANDAVLYESAAHGLAHPAPLLAYAADAAFRGGDSEKARALFDEAVRATPDDGALLARRSSFLLYLAEFCVEQARLAIGRGDTAAVTDWGAARARWLDLATAPLDAALARGLSTPELLEARGFAAMIARDTETALSWFLRAYDAGSRSATLAKNWPEGLLQLRVPVHALAQGPQLNEAISRYSHLVRLACGADPPARLPEPIAEPLVTIACELADLMMLPGGDRASAELRYQSILQLAPRTSRAHEGLGRLAKDRGDRKEAIRQFKEALIIDPDAFYALSEMLTMSQEDGNTQDAQMYFVRWKDVIARKGKPNDH